MVLKSIYVTTIQGGKGIQAQNVSPSVFSAIFKNCCKMLSEGQLPSGKKSSCIANPPLAKRSPSYVCACRRLIRLLDNTLSCLTSCHMTGHFHVCLG